MYIQRISTAPQLHYKIFQPAGNPANELVQTTETSFKAAKSKVQETFKKQWAAMQPVQTAESQAKVERLVAKFNSGKKLSSAELRYVMTHAPGEAERIMRLTAERERLERMLRASPTKLDTLMFASMAMKAIDQRAPTNPEEAAVRANHLQDALQKYQNTDHYKNKPNDLWDDKKQKKSANPSMAAVLMLDMESSILTRMKAQLAYLKVKELSIQPPITTAAQNR